MNTFDPIQLRHAFGRFLTGVVVVVTKNDQGAYVGFTANSFSSVSIEPPLINVCPGNFLSSYQAFRECKQFTVSILADDQKDIAQTFAGFKGDRFAAVTWHAGDQTDLPIITNASASFECSTFQALPAGDHTILLGQVLAFTDNNRAGLGYLAGEFVTL